MFQILNPEQQAEYRKWVVDNYHPESDSYINPTWHPVAQDECYRLLLEYMATDSDYDQSEIEEVIVKRSINEAKVVAYTTNVLPNQKTKHHIIDNNETEN